MSFTDPRPAKRERTTEDRVVGEVWRELGGLLSEEFAVPSDRARRLDALVIESDRRELIRADEMPALGHRRVWAVEVKAGAVGMGVLGQALFGAQLLARRFSAAQIVPLAAAIRPPSPDLQRLLDEFHPGGIQWRCYPHAARAGRSQGSSGEPNPPALREAMLDWHAQRAGGALIAVGQRRTRRDFAGVRASATGRTLASLGVSGLILRDRFRERLDARTADIVIDSAERVELIYTCTDLYRTQMGGALFGAELARRLIGLHETVGIALYRRENRILRELFSRYPNAQAVHYPH